MFEDFDEKDTSNFASCDSLIVTPKIDCFEVLVNGLEDMCYFFTQKELHSILRTVFPKVSPSELFSNTYLETPLLIDKKGVHRANIKTKPVYNNITLADCGFF